MWLWVAKKKKKKTSGPEEMRVSSLDNLMEFTTSCRVPCVVEDNLDGEHQVEACDVEPCDGRAAYHQHFTRPGDLEPMLAVWTCTVPGRSEVSPRQCAVAEDLPRIHGYSPQDGSHEARVTTKLTVT